MAYKGDEIDPVTKRMSKIDIAPVAPIMMPNQSPGEIGNKQPIQTNTFGLMITNDVLVYINDIRIFADLSEKKTVEFTKKGKDDCLVNDRKEKCVAVIEAIIGKNKEVFTDKYKVYYDGQSILYTLNDIFKSGDNFVRFTIDGKDLKIPELQSLPLIIVEVKPSITKRKFTVSAESLVTQTANLDLAANDRYLIQFLEIAINQYAIMHPERHKVFENGKTFMTNPLKEGLKEIDIKKVGDGKALLVGTKKSIRLIEGPRGRQTTNIALVVDAKKAAFHLPHQNVADKCADILRSNLDKPFNEVERDKVSGVLKGLFVETTHLKHNKRFQVYGLSKGSAIDSVFENNGVKISVSQYFAEKYTIMLKAPHIPLLLSKERGNMNVYPMEVCRVIPFQRVTIPQQTPEQSQQSTRECAVTPVKRQDYIMCGVRSLELLNEENLYISNAGIKVYRVPLKVQGRYLPAPNILFGASKVEQPDFGKWKTRNQKYLLPAEFQVWAIYGIPDRRNSFTVNELQIFGRKFYDTCLQRGMRIGTPQDIQVIPEADLEKRIETAAAHNCQYILFVIGDSLLQVHKNMKYFERKYDCVTQQMKASNMFKIMNEGKVMTLENIINKTNCKLGGLCYGFDLTHLNGVAQKWFVKERIILGISLTHPAPTSFNSGERGRPSVVGFSANMKTCPFEFIGDFMYQDSNKMDTLPCIEEVVGQVVKRHAAAHNGPIAKELIIYRNGIDEGSFQSILSNEIPAIKSALAKHNLSKIKIAFIVCAKTASDVRLFNEKINPNEKAPTQNILPGLVVDTQLTHPAFNEFYLNSHTTLQGSAKTPRYTVLFDELEMTNDHVQGMTFALSHNHQIVSLTTSLPANVYIASRYSERGMALWMEYLQKDESSSDNSSGFDEAIRHLTYSKTKIGNFRVNA